MLSQVRPTHSELPEGGTLGTAAKPASASGPYGHVDAGISSNELFSGLAVLGLFNGFSERVITIASEKGIAASLLDTFDISMIVWGASAAAVLFLWRGSGASDPVPAAPARTPRSARGAGRPVDRMDWIVAAFVLAAVLIPIVPLSWLALTGLAIYAACRSPRGSFAHRGACILLATTVPMFWARLLFAALSDYILLGDATLVGWLVGTQRSGNAIAFADGSGYLWIEPGCSSLANVSLTVLCWVTVANILNRREKFRDVGWVLAASCAVVAINVVRISLLGCYPQFFDLIHGTPGSTVAGLMTLAAILGICLLGVRRDLPARL